MFLGIRQGDVTSDGNPAKHIIIAMNTTLSEPSALGRPYAGNVVLSRGPLDLGSVVTYDFPKGRQLHMVICHKIGDGGWKDVGQNLRYGLDHLKQLHQTREISGEFSIVHVGTGQVGLRDGAPQSEIMQAMANSWLPIMLWVLPEETQYECVSNVAEILRPREIWTRRAGIYKFTEADQTPMRAAA